MWPAGMTPPPGEETVAAAEETAPKKYLREAEDLDCHGVPVSPQPPDAGHRPLPHTGGPPSPPPPTAPPNANTYTFCCFCLPS